MKVLFLSQVVPYPPHGGVLQRGFNLLREAGRSVDVHLLAFCHPDILATAAAVRESVEKLSEFCRTVEYFPLWPKRSALHRLAALAGGLLSAEPFSVIAHRSQAFRRRVEELAGGGGFDLVHADTIALAPFVAAPGRLPAVLTHHNIESVLMERRARAERGGLARRYLLRESRKLREYERRHAGRFEVNITVSAADAQTLAAIAPGVRTAVVPNGVDTRYFTVEAGDEKPALIYVGGMNMFANRDAVLHFVTQVLPGIRARAPEVSFCAVGQDPPRELQALARRDPGVTCVGFVSDIRPLVRQAAVYVVPLRVGGGTRLKVLDAMACGKAIVSTAIGCEGIAARPGEHLLVADTPEAFAEAVLGLLADPGRRRALGSAARRLVETTYSWTIVGAQLLDCYDKVLASRSARQ